MNEDTLYNYSLCTACGDQHKWPTPKGSFSWKSEPCAACGAPTSKMCVELGVRGSPPEWWNDPKRA